MNLSIHSTPQVADAVAARLVKSWLLSSQTRNVMVAGGNTPLAFYGLIASERLALSHLNVFALDEYVGVPPEDSRTCANLLRRCVAEAWGVPAAQFFPVSSKPAEARAGVEAQETRLREAGGLDLVILGLGQNGHLGFNEPGSLPDSSARLVPLSAISVAANRRWFQDQYAPEWGVTHGLKTILEARRVLVLAYGSHKTAAVKAAVEGPPNPDCPASFLQQHPEAWLFLDALAAQGLSSRAVPS